MPSSIADPLYERLLRAFPADRAYARDDWSSEPMPEPIRHFLAQLLRHQSRHEAERLRTARTDWVNYDHPDMERAVRSFFAAVEDHMQVPRSEWEDTLHQATHHVTAYLVQPTHVLGEFVFGETDTALHLDRVTWRMKFFGPYAYLRDAVRAYAEQRDSDTFTRSAFETFLRRIDARITAEYNADRWMRLLDPLVRLARVATEDETIPLRPLRIFFREKDATLIADRLQRAAETGRSHIHPQDLRALIRGDEPGRSRADATSSAQPPTPSTPDLHSADALSSNPSSATPSRDTTASSPETSRSETSESEVSEPASYSMEDVSRASRSGGTVPQDETQTQKEREQKKTQAKEETESRDDSNAQRSASAASATEERDAASPVSAEDAPPEPDGLDDDGGDRGTIWGVAGSAREVGDDRSEPADSGDDDSMPLWKQFQQGRSRSSADPGASAGEGDTPLWARFRSDRAPRGEQMNGPGAAQGNAGGPSRAEIFGTDADGQVTGDAAGAASETAEETADDSAPSPSASSPSRADLKALEQSVLGESNPPQRGVFVRQLFGDSMDHYVHVLQRLDEAGSWSEASQIIAQDVFRKNKVNIYSDAAVHFTNAVESRFRK